MKYLIKIAEPQKPIRYTGSITSTCKGLTQNHQQLNLQCVVPFNNKQEAEEFLKRLLLIWLFHPAHVFIVVVE